MPSTGPRTTWRPPSKRASRSTNRLRLSSHADSGAGREGDLDPARIRPDQSVTTNSGRPTEKGRATRDDIARRSSTARQAAPGAEIRAPVQLAQRPERRADLA